MADSCYKLFDSEKKVMEVLWEHGTMTAGDVVKILKETIGWNRNTTYTVMKKCIAKGAVERTEPHFTCTPLITREQVQDYETNELVDKMFDGLGEVKTKNMHVHFSKIQYGAKGEIRHLTFADTVYGPKFEPFCNVIVKNGLTPHILSESAGTQMLDSKTMKNLYLSKI